MQKKKKRKDVANKKLKKINIQHFNTYVDLIDL